MLGQRLQWLAGKWFVHSESGHPLGNLRGSLGFIGRKHGWAVRLSCFDFCCSCFVDAAAQLHTTLLPGQGGTGIPCPPLAQFQKHRCLPVSGGPGYRSEFQGAGLGQLFFRLAKLSED